MALNHNDVELPELIINHFNTLADYQAAYQGGFISGTDITFIDENIQADWDETDSGSPAYIKNKPVISGGSTSVQSNWNQNDPSAADYIKNKPTIPSVTGTNDGTNWTTITIGSTTKNIPSGGGGGGSSTLAGLTDTSISSPSSGQILAYDSSTSKWINSAPERELFVCTMTYLNSVYSCDKTWAEIYAAYQDGKLPILVYDSNIYQCSQIGDTFGAFSYSAAINFLSLQRTAIQTFFYDGNGDLLPQGWTRHSFNSVQFSESDKTKLDNIASGAEVNVQADWAETGTTNDAYIKNKPTIGNGVLTIQKNGTKVDAFSANQTTNTTIDITVPTTASDINALPSSTKYASSLSLSMDPTTFVVTGQLKDQDNNNLGSAQTLDLPLETMVVGGHYNSGTQKVVLELKSGSTVEFSVADLVSGLVNATTFNNHVVSGSHITATERTNWNGKQDKISDLSQIRTNAASGWSAYQTVTAHTGNTNIHVTTSEKSTWSGKQDAISDIGQIRTNAASGWSAYQTVTAHTGSTTLHLPPVTSTDSGKILQVSSAGTWQLVSPVTIYSGTGTPAQNLGKDGDIYIQTT
jgi:hypothetical protein